MNFITGKHLSRRTFLHGTSASVALPFFDAMVPAGRAWRDPAQAFTRLICLEEDLGHAGGNAWGDSQHLFGPAKIGRDFELGERHQLKLLEAYREYMTIVSNTDCRMGEPYRPEEVAAHSKETSLFLTQSHALLKSGGSEVFLGKSLDQLHADRFGQDTPLPSLELTTGDDAPGGGCEYGYHCAYSQALSWASPTQPLPAISEPRAVFEQLFGTGDSPADRANRLRTNASVLDYVATNLARLKRELGATDRQALDAFTTDIRELERRIDLVEAQNSSGEERELPQAPSRDSGFMGGARGADARSSSARAADRHHAGEHAQVHRAHERELPGERGEQGLAQRVAPRERASEHHGLPHHQYVAHGADDAVP